ncbi:MAG: hypothetical protein P4L42_13840 [Desulfocapsaceae bacterium]|nr:hypothetical protein [Desulfocapsaceae bacterium]
MKSIKFLNIKILIVVACLLLPVSYSFSMIRNETYIVTGKIDAISDKEIRFANGELFQLSPSIKGVSSRTGDTVTIRYFVNSQGNNICIEIASGANALQEIVIPLPPPPNQKM